jgi:hypothetical protein
MTKLKKGAATGTITLVLAVSAFAFVAPRIEGYAATCTPESYSAPPTTTTFNGIKVVDYFILYWIDNANQTGCANYGDYFFYQRFATTLGLLLRVGSWDTNGYAYITDQTGACQLGFCVAAGNYGAKWNAYSGCQIFGSSVACTSGQFATRWIPIPSGIFPPRISGESDFNTDSLSGGIVDPSVVEDTGGNTQRLATAYISNQGP